MNLINIRKVGYGVRSVGKLVEDITGTGHPLPDGETTLAVQRTGSVQEQTAVSGLIEEIVSELKKQGIYGGDR